MSVNSENTKAQMRKGVLELCILSILSQGDAYPTEIIDKLKETKLVVGEERSSFRTLHISQRRDIVCEERIRSS